MREQDLMRGYIAMLKLRHVAVAGACVMSVSKISAARMQAAKMSAADASAGNAPDSQMSMLSSPHRYGAVTQLFHWLTVVLVGTAYIVSPGGPEDRIYSPAFDFSRQLHETLGILVFALVLLRILWRLFEPTPEPPPLAPWMKYSAVAAHLGLYALLLAIPSTAIAGAWLEAHPITLFGIGTIGPMLPQAHDLGQTIAYIHTILGNVIIWLAGFHAVAALFHHFILRDSVLTSMLPARMRLPAPAGAPGPGCPGP
jgi:cytochrome b561